MAANPTDQQVAEEFFELFKTPWEPAVRGRKYRAVLCTGGRIDGLDADVFLVYSSTERPTDRLAGVAVEQVDPPLEVEWNGSGFPLYGRAAVFGGSADPGVLRLRGRAADYRHRVGTRAVWRIGYDLFREVRHLLTKGQPALHAATPTLELHIDLLRHALLESGVPFVEIPPLPQGHDFICCLTHDVDFFGISRHRFDRTLAGFVARASLGTLRDLARGRRPLAEALRNWSALLSLPLVHLGLAPDFWRPFDSYARADEGRPSTFFLVPFRGRPGAAPDGGVDAARAVPYQVSEIGAEARAAATRGSELAVHGIDAWRDADAGRSEMNEVASITGQAVTGVRMHWLYFAPDSPRQLEAAGFDYDSTCGYNEAVGYRAGTAQVFRAAGTRALMELPLSIMDTALFSAGRMGLARDEALRRCQQLIAHAGRFGGTLVINWHCRSLAPERLWGRFYRALLDEVRQGGRVWFATAGDAVAWFRWRRSIRFCQVTVADGSRARVHVSAAAPARRTGVLRVHRPGRGRAHVEDRQFDGSATVDLDARADSPRTLHSPYSQQPINPPERSHERRAYPLS